MMTDSRASARPSAARLLLTASVLAVGLSPLPAGWARTAREGARSRDLNRADRVATAGSYYEALIGGDGKDRRGAPGALELALIGDPIGRNRDLVKRITRDLDRDFLQFELKPDLDEVFFGERFTTNARGMRDREYPVSKADGVYRIALLGASIDMGWGVATPDTYENLLESWLNAEAARRHLPRRFEVLNFAMAAYGPAQRYEAFRRKALGFEPDMVLTASTMIDPRLLEIHLGGLIKNRVDWSYDFLRLAASEAGIDPARERLAASDKGFKARVKEGYWIFADAVLAALAADCRSRDVPLAVLLIPRACRDDADDARALTVARSIGGAARHAVPVLDLSATFDGRDPSSIEIAPGDDHPNALGHRLLFEGLRRALLGHPGLSAAIFEPGR